MTVFPTHQSAYWERLEGCPLAISSGAPRKLSESVLSTFLSLSAVSAQPASKNCGDAVVLMFKYALIGGEMFARSDDNIPRIRDANATADEPRGWSAERLLQI